MSRLDGGGGGAAAAAPQFYFLCSGSRPTTIDAIPIVIVIFLITLYVLLTLLFSTILLPLQWQWTHDHRCNT